MDHTNSIAVIGMSCRVPGAESLERFWHNLCCGISARTEFSECDLVAAGVPRELFRSPQYVRAGYVLENPDHFDAGFFALSPREAEVMDPQHRLFLESAWHSLEDAGYAGQTSKIVTGIFAGCGISNYSALFSDTSNLRQASTDNLRILLANEKDYLPSRVAYKLDLRGPVVGIQTACSTSLVAVCQACDALLSNQCDIALAGAVTLKIPQRTGYLYEPGGVQSADCRCRAFDAGADGAAFGSGLGIVVLKRLDDALRDNDQIRAVIRGWAVNNDGARSPSFSAPSLDGQAEVIAAAMAVSDIDPCMIGYVEAHGTGTPLGDVIEMAAVNQAFELTPGYQPRSIGSVKSSIGHLETASGVAGLIKTILCVQHRTLVPSLNFAIPNPEINFKSAGFHVQTRCEPWLAPGPARAGVNSFGMGGTNAHVVIEQAPAHTKPKRSGFVSVPITVSAASEASLVALTEALADRIRDAPDAFLDLAYTMSVRQPHFRHRIAVTADRGEKAEQRLRAAVRSRPSGVVPNRRNKVAFLFTGQGCQYLKMAAECYNRFPRFRRTLDRCNAMFSRLGARDLISLIYEEDNAGVLKRTLNAQPALFAVEYAMADLLHSWAVRPGIVVGHSLGEYVAATVAGIMSLEDAAHLVYTRATLMDALGGHGRMVSVCVGESDLAPYLATAQGAVSLAAVNAPSVCALAGESSALAAICARLRRANIDMRELEVSAPFHSSAMEPMIAEFEKVAARFTYGKPEIPIISNISGRLDAGEMSGANYWCRHILSTVRFADGVRTAYDEGARIFIEIGPRPVLTALVRRTLDDKGVNCYQSLSPNTPDSLQLATTLGSLYTDGIDIDWRHYYEGESLERVRVPLYPFEKKRFWHKKRAEAQDVVSPLEQITLTSAQASAIPRSMPEVDPIESLLRQGEQERLLEYIRRIREK